MFAGIDTSNYTTSVAVFDGEHIIQNKKLLTVKKGERGLRQSDALFQHTVNLPVLISKLKSEIGDADIEAFGVSNRPRNIEGSYMPRFWLANPPPKQQRHFVMHRFSKPRIRLGIFWRLFIPQVSRNLSTSRL